MSVWHLAWIIPVCLTAGFAVSAALSAGRIRAAEEVLREARREK